MGFLKPLAELVNYLATFLFVWFGSGFLCLMLFGERAAHWQVGYVGLAILAVYLLRSVGKAKGRPRGSQKRLPDSGKSKTAA